MKRQFFLILLSAFMGSAWAQEREIATWTYFSLAKKMSNRWTLSTQTELRTGDDNTSLYLWYLDGSAQYKVNTWFSAGMGIDYIKIHSHATATRRDVWRTDWRPYVSLNARIPMGALRTSFNESWTYNWMPETMAGQVIVHGKAFFLLRHRLTIEYPLSETRFTPYLRGEIRHTRQLERFRTTIGTTIRLTDHTSLDAAYIYQDKHLSTKTHALSIGYRIRL